MKCTVEKDLLLTHLQKVCNVIGRKYALPILGNIWLEAEKDCLILVSTDLEIRVETRLKASVKKTGKTTLPAKSLLALVSKFDGGEVHLECDANFHTTISHGNSESKFLGLAPADFPAPVEFKPERKICLEQSTLGRLIDSVSFVVDMVESRKVLQGILFSVKDNILTVIATDGKRLALHEKAMENSGDNGDIILPLKSAQEVKRLLGKEGDVTIEISDKRIQFLLGDTTLESRLIEGSYPNFRQVIPAAFTRKVDLTCASFLSALDLVAVPLNGESGNVKLTFQQNELELYSQSNSIGEGWNKLNIIYEDKEKFKVTFNIRYLLEPFKFAGLENLQIQMNTPDSPIALSDGEFRYIIMPMRIK